VRVTIDNLDGAGALDYSAALSADGPIKIERTLNAPSLCTAMLDVNAPISSTPLPVPARRARIVVTADNGTILFTGYLATEPERVYAGVATTGPAYRILINAVSDEWLLDKQTLAPSGAGLAQPAGQLLQTLTNRVDATRFTTTGLSSSANIGVFEPQPDATWSANAGSIASASYAAYRVLNGALALQPAGTIAHTFSDGDGTLQLATLKTASIKELANDITLSGEIEPAAYISETFAGDGTTAVFQLAQAPFRSKRTANSSHLLSDSFNTGTFDTRLWQVSDSGSHLSLTSAGLAMTGGNGFDGQTTLTAIDLVELGGSLVIEAGNVQLNSPSDGVLCGLYRGDVARANCVAGYNVRTTAGTTIVVPFVNGAETGTAFTLLNGHTYTLRIHLHSVEPQRMLQTYYAMVNGALQAFGGGEIPAPASIVFELQDLGASSNTPATILYDGSIASATGSCTFAAVNSVELTGSMGYCRITQTGSAWLVSTLPSGVKQTRLIGSAGDGVDCTISATGKVTFFAGRIPVAGELITATYRTSRRAVARLEDSASVAAETAAGFPGMAKWQGKVTQPQARSTQDCESAAQAILSFATSRSAAVSGNYATINPAQDIWPGDVLALSSNGQTTSVVVRKVTLEDGHAAPELLTCNVAFANDWAEALGMKLSGTIAADAILPATASATPANVLANLQQLQLVSATGTALQVDAGIDPPAGGGFEVRRADWGFGPGIDQDLVLRSPVRSFSIPREAQVERFYVRMYSGSTPPVYSRFSSAVFTNLPVSI
jgi:hypothetical protein